MKLRKLEAAYAKAQSAERSTKAALEKVVERTRLAAESLKSAKAASRKARKDLKLSRKEAASARSAHQDAKQDYFKATVLVSKLDRKLRKAEKKAAEKGKITKSISQT